MKESIWGYWLIMLGISVLTIMMLLQNYTTINQEDYYLLKEVTQAALYDSIDYNYYNKYGELKINREVFIEMFERRFANSIKSNKTYKTDFYEIFESPPKVSVRVSTSTSSFQVSNSISDLSVTNDIDAILEQNGDKIITVDFYSLSYASCNSSSDQDAKGYCTHMNTFSLNDNLFKSSASKELKDKYNIDIIKDKFNIISIKHIGNMKSDGDFRKFLSKYNQTYGILYESIDGRISEDNIITKDHYATEIKDVVLLTNNKEQYGYSLKYKCPETTQPFTLKPSGTITEDCLIGLKYQIKFIYEP